MINGYQETSLNGYVLGTSKYLETSLDDLAHEIELYEAGELEVSALDHPACALVISLPPKENGFQVIIYRSGSAYFCSLTLLGAVSYQTKLGCCSG